MAWYDDKKKTDHIAHYKDADKDADAAEHEQREAATKGWAVRATAAPERVAVGRAITKGLFTAGAGLLKGRPRKGGTITVTYERTAASPTDQDADDAGRKPARIGNNRTLRARSVEPVCE